MDVVGTRQRETASQRVDKPAPLDERGRHAEDEEREPSERDEVAAGQDPQARYPDRQERDVAHCEGGREIRAAINRTDERERPGVGRREHERTGPEDDDRSDRIVELRGRDAE